MTEETLDRFEIDKSQIRQYWDWLHVRIEKQFEILKKVESALEKVESALEKMESFSKTKKNMHLPIRDGIQKAKKELGALWYDIEDAVCYLDSFEYLMRGLMVKKIKEVKLSKNKGVVDDISQTLPQPAARSTPDRRKRRKEPPVSPEMPVVTKPIEKRPKASKKEEESPQEEGPLEEERKEAFQHAGETLPCAPRSGAHQTSGRDELRYYPART